MSRHLIDKLSNWWLIELRYIAYPAIRTVRALDLKSSASSISSAFLLPCHLSTSTNPLLLTMVLTPQFTLTQTLTHLTVTIRLPYIRVGDAETIIDGESFTFFCKVRKRHEMAQTPHLSMAEQGSLVHFLVTDSQTYATHTHTCEHAHAYLTHHSTLALPSETELSWGPPRHERPPCESHLRT